MQPDQLPIAPQERDGVNDKSRAAYVASLFYLQAGIGTLPIMADSSKSPALDTWKELESRLPTEEELAEWYGCGAVLGVGTICGKVSGNMELLDFDHNCESVYLQWRELVDMDCDGLTERLSVASTPSGGRHVRYRVEGFDVPGSDKLARTADNKHTIIETRGEGGYALAPGCPTECHKTGRLYEHVAGPIIPPIIIRAERDAMVRCARSFDEAPAKHAKPTRGSSASPSANGHDLRPGDDFDLRGDWSDILEPHGWTALHGGRDGVRYWRRPGKTDKGWSATTGRCRGPKGEELLHVFSSNAHPFEGEKTYGRFNAFALLNHAGNHSEAAKALSAKGCGSNPSSGGRIKRASRIDPSQVVEDGEDYHLTDLGNAKRIASAHGHDMRFSHAQKTWYIWDGRRWKADDDGEAVRCVKATQADFYATTASAIEELSGSTDPERKEKLAALSRQLQHALKWEDARRIAASLKLLESEPGIPLAVGEIDSNPWLLNCLNGTVDLRSGKISAHAPLESISKLAPVNYDAEAQCPNWLRCLNDWMCGNVALVDYLRRIVGYSLTADVREQVLFFLHGDGSNGKSTFLGMIREMLGDYGHQSVSELLMQRNTEAHPTERAALFGKRFVATIETDQGKRMAESLMKQITGGDPIQARKMRQDFFEFLPTWKIFLAANHKPNIKGQDYAVWRRIRLIAWMARFDEKSKDATLAGKLKAELPGILAWAVRGCLEWQQTGLADPKEVTDATKAYQNDQDTLGCFLSECCVIAPFAKVKSSVLLKSFHEFANTKEMSRQTLQKRLNEKGFQSERQGANYWYLGIGLDADNFDDNESRFV